MPVERCTLDGQPGFRWGEEGKCYTYTPGNEASRNEARRKAILQGVAVEGGDISDFEELMPQEQEHFAEESASAFRDVMIISEFRGSYPDVPIADGVDYGALVAGDDNPVFVTLPIGKINATSGNKRFYDAAFVAELERQVLANKPVGLMGHLNPDQRATEFPNEAVHWVGAKCVGEVLWGKGYLPRGDARDRLQRYRATNAKIATSIDAWAEGIWDDQLGAYRMQADTLRLGQIDIAPADRAGIADLAAIPHFTREMAHSHVAHDITKELDDMDKTQVLQEMTVQDVPDKIRQVILETVEQPPEVAQMAQIRETLSLDAKADVLTAVQELKRQQEEQAHKDVQRRIRELAATGEKAVKVEAVRSVVIELVQAHKPQTIQEAESAYAEVIESEAVKRLLAAQVREIMGPNQGTPVHGQNGGPKYFVIPEEAD